MATVSRENIGLLNDKISIKLEKTDYLSSFEKKLKDYSKTANIPGFRKGMVPTGMIKKMYGPSIFADEVMRAANQELIKYLEENRPDIFAQPLPIYDKQMDLDIDKPGDYEFNFEIGLKPEFSIPEIESADLTLFKVEATDEMVDEEIKRMVVKGGEMTEPENISNDEDVINFSLSESDENGNLIEGGSHKENSVTLKDFNSDFKKQLEGKVKGDKITVQLKSAFNGELLKSISKDLNSDDSSNKYFVLEILKIGRVEKRELNEAFFEEVIPGKSIKTEEDFRIAIKEEIQNYWNSQARNQVQDQVYHFLLDNTQMEFPQDFLKKWLQNGGEKEKSAEEIEREFPTFINQLKWTLISDKLIKDNKLEVKEADIRDSMRNQVLQYFGTMNIGEDMSWLDNYLDKMMKDENQVDEVYRRVSTEKLFSFLDSKVKTKEKIVSQEEFNSKLHHHHH